MVSSLKKMKLIAISATMSLLLAAMLACNIGGEADAPAAEPMASEPIKFGMILVGPREMIEDGLKLIMTVVLTQHKKLGLR